MRRSAFLVALALLGGCSSAVRPEVLQSWVGRPATSLRQDWGPPTRELDDGGLRLLIYEQFESRTGRDFSTPSSAGKLGASRAPTELAQAPSRTVYARSYLFWVDAGGVIVRVDVRQP